MENMQFKKDFFIEQSEIDHENKCVHVPVNSLSNLEYDDLYIMKEDVRDELLKKYQNINFSGKMELNPKGEKEKEFLFYFD